MRVDRIELDGFRNYEGFAADFHPGVNVIWGENAQGKTNLLEAIGYLSGARSHRTRGDRDLISFSIICTYQFSILAEDFDGLISKS